MPAHKCNFTCTETSKCKIIIDQLMFFSLMMLCSILPLTALPYSLGRNCVAQQAVCLDFISCETPFICNCVSHPTPPPPFDEMFPPPPSRQKATGAKKSLKDFFLIGFPFQVQEHDGKSWFWLSGESFMPANQNHNPSAPPLMGVEKVFPCGGWLEMDCSHSQLLFPITYFVKKERKKYAVSPRL